MGFSWSELWRVVGPWMPSFERLMLVLAAWLTWDQFRRNKAAGFIQRFNSREIHEIRARIDLWLRTHPDATARLRALDRDPALNAEVRMLLNLFQEIGVAYFHGIVHRKEIRDYFDVLVPHYWETLGFVIQRARVQQNYSLYRRFERLHQELARLRKDDPTVITYVFAYGSLLDPESAGRTLGAAPALAAYVPARLRGWRRAWTVADRVRLDDDGREVSAVFLDLEADVASVTPGALLRVDAAGLQALEKRERHYDVVDVTAAIEVVENAPLSPRGRAHARIVTFVGRVEHRPGPEAVALDRYVTLVEDAARLHGATFEREFLDTLPGVAPRERVAGRYRFVSA